MHAQNEDYENDTNAFEYVRESSEPLSSKKEREL